MRSGSSGTLTSVEIRGLINDCLHSSASSTVAKYIREVRKLKIIPSKERLLKLHGRWKTDLAKDMYIKESVDQRLSLVKNLGS